MSERRLSRDAFARVGFAAAALAGCCPSHAGAAPPHAILSHHPPDLILAAIMLGVGTYVAAILLKRIWWDNR